MSRQPRSVPPSLESPLFSLATCSRDPPCFSHLCAFCLPASVLCVFSHRSLHLDGLFAHASVPHLCPIHCVGTSTSGSVNSCSWLGKLCEEKQETADGCSYCCLNIWKHKMSVKRQGGLSPGRGLQSSLQKEHAVFLLLL